MQDDLLASLTHVPDATLIEQVKTLIRRERDVTAELIAHLAELDTRDLHLREGYPSLFVYCRDALGLSDWEAYNRIDVARAVRRFPTILGMLAEGSVTLSAARLLAPHLTVGNHLQVLDSARGKTKVEVERIVAGLSPRPDVAFSVRRQRQPEPPTMSAVSGALADLVPGGPSAAGAGSGGAARSLPCPAKPVRPLSPDRYKLELTIGGDTVEKLRLAKDMLGHAIPSGDEAAILDRALTALLDDLAKKKFADTPRPRRAQALTPAVENTQGVRRPAARQPSAAVKRAVWVRDLERCAFIGSSGHRCAERRFVEFHHVDPYALGGMATVDGIHLRCRSHNDYEGLLYFGKRRRHELVPEQVRLSP